VLAGSIKRFEKNSENFDVVFDFALPATGATTQEKINQSGQFYKNILKCAALVKPGGRIVHPSSGATYGDLRYTTRLCEDSTTSPQNLSIYGETKLGIENLSPTFQSAGIDFVTPRIFSVFGPLMREDSPLVGNTFLREAAKGHKIEARQSVEVFRDFIFVSDLVKQLIQVGIEKTSIKNINLGSHNRLEIATFGKLVGSSAGVEFTEGLTQNPPDKYFGCLHHLELNHPELVRSCTSVTQGIDRTLAFYQAE
jgi:nucleoside-diphosphate-sugar epimerase